MSLISLHGLDIYGVYFFVTKYNDTKVQAVNESFLQKVRLLEKLDEIQKNYFSNMIDAVIANKRIKQALSSAMSFTI